MNMTSKQIYDSLIYGAYNVIKNKEILNKINLFPVQDGDTGSNLSSMMRTIIQKAELKSTVKKTLESIADASLHGARGNSGIIFAQYFRGLCETITDGEQISISEYATASKCAAQYAYDAVEEPVEGTMITVMKEWGSLLSEESCKRRSLEEAFTNAFKKLEVALEKTKEQLPVLRKANVVDSGAMGFTCFIEGALYYIRNEGDLDHFILQAEKEKFEELEFETIHTTSKDFRYCTECLLESNGYINITEIKKWLSQMGDSIVVAGNQSKCRIHIHTNIPAEVFDYLYDKGDIIYQKVDDMQRQEAVVKHRKYEIALVTDSIADIPQALIDEHQIHIVHLDILFKNIIYIDKLTIQPARLLHKSKDEMELPTSSQPNPKNIENLLDYLSTYYKSIIIMTVSKELSGTYNNFFNVAKNFKNKDFKISVINTKQNSGAQGLLVKKCAELIKDGLAHDEIVKRIEDKIQSSKILVQVKTIDNMIKSGRLSVRAGRLAKRVGMKPIITLDKDGKGTLENVAFSLDGSNKKIIRHIKKIMKDNIIEQYNIVHVNNEAGAKELAKSMINIIGSEPVYITETSSIIAVGAGDGAVAISYLLNKKGGDLLWVYLKHI